MEQGGKEGKTNIMLKQTYFSYNNGFSHRSVQNCNAEFNSYMYLKKKNKKPKIGIKEQINVYCYDKFLK
jgi:hypothetical protein